MFTSLIQELLNWSDKHSQHETGRKAFRLYVRCLRSRPATAERIEKKYGHLFPPPDDTTIALALAMQARRHTNDTDFSID